MKRKRESKKNEQARLVIRNAGDMSMATKRNIARWLYYQAALLIQEGNNYADYFKSTRTKMRTS